MVNVAIAGGTGGIGRAIVEGIKEQGKHQVKVLARKTSPELEAKTGATIIAIDYDNVDSLTKVLEDNQIDTVISTLSIMFTIDPEINLIRAAEASKSTKRFIPSSWGIAYTEEHVAVFPLAGLKLQSIAELKKTNLEWTRVNTGYFLDYWGMPKVPSYLVPNTVVVDLPANVAAIPGSGNTPVVFTHTFDVAKYVSAALDLEKWEEDSYIIGDKVTWNEFVALAEEAKGTKIDVTYDSVDLLKSGNITELPAHKPVYPFFPKEQLQGLFAVFGLFFEDGSFDFKPAHSLNDDFPDIKPTTVKALLQKAWGQ